MPEEEPAASDHPEIRPGDGPDELRVFDHGFVRLDACMADDLSVVNSARVSFAVRKEEMDERDEGLIKFLMRESHGTPTEHNAFRFHIRCPVFVAREWFRHRVGSFNEESARYHKLSDDFYVPAPEAVRSQVGKPGSYSFEPVDAELAEETRRSLKESYETAYEVYRNLVDKGVAKELARAALPFGIYTQFYWTVNARSLMNFLALRNAVTAQYEIRVYAQAVERFFADKMPATYRAFLDSGRKVP
ncbi:MAG: FAD-dependent thymidylate synthase [Actinomycetota bacterium]